jgi:hypothetical protein
MWRADDDDEKGEQGGRTDKMLGSVPG